MDIETIETLVTSYIDQSIEGLDKENPKFDFKAIWYDLKSPKGVSEFLKDTTAIVNTFGPDGYIVVGFDDKKKEFTQATFKDSKLRDSSDVINLINGKIDRLFVVNTVDIEVKGNKLSIIHIPASIDKPHIIKKYITYENDGHIKKEEENKIFVRKNSRAISASKYDIDLMYYDRKNIDPDYELRANSHIKATVFNINLENKLQLSTNLTIENIGRRPVAISALTLILEIGDRDSRESFKMISDPKYLGNNLIIKSGEISNKRIDFFSKELLRLPDNREKNMKQRYFNDKRKDIDYANLEIKLANGSIIFSELKMIQ